MKPAVLKFLTCMSCGSSIELGTVSESITRDDGIEEVISGCLKCTECDQNYPVMAGVPRFVSTDTSTDVDIHSGRRFTESWKQFSRLDKRYWDQFFGWVNPVTPDFIKGKIVLEAGCGKGRHTDIISRAGATEVVSVDIGDSVDVAFRNVGHLPNVHIIQADIMCMPVRADFDYALSVGVLHHMASPFDGFKSLLSKTRPDGDVSAWVYGRENNGWIIHVLNPIRETITSRLPRSVVRFISILLTIPLYTACKFVASPWSKLQSKVSWLPKFYYQDYLCAISEFDAEEMLNIVFDHLIAPVAFYISEDELKKWLSDTGLKNSILRWHNQNSWTIFATRQNMDPARRIEECSQDRGENSKV